MSDEPICFTELRPQIEAELQRALLSKTGGIPAGRPTRLHDAMQYALLTPGKRLRPMLVLLSARACGITDDELASRGVWSAACAVEFIHAYSLIHDDLPAMDDDDLRRGQPTVHRQFDEATAILAGDALQADAFAMLARGVARSSVGVQALQILAEAAGSGALVGGQADDLAAETIAENAFSSTNTLSSTNTGTQSSDQGTGRSLSGQGPSRSLQFLESIHRRKTGALFLASIDIGSLLGGASVQERVRLSEYARALGLAFQVVDDWLDATSNANVLGKRGGKDAERGKLTYTVLLGVEAARQKAIDLIADAKAALAEVDGPTEALFQLADFVGERTR
ncbi:MAG: polyprenyl synthetase family protein [Planctomycetota bacterium]